MSGDVPLGYRIRADGADQTIASLRALHEQLRQGTITTKEYRQEHRELTTVNHASVGEFNDIKNAISASNPNLLEFTRTMGMFGSVANTAMSAMNTINLLVLAGAPLQQQLSDAYRQAASDYNDYIRLFSSTQYGPGSPVTEAAHQKYMEDLRQIQNLQKQQAVQSIETAITVVTTSVAMAGSISQQVIAFQALTATMSATKAESLALALSTVGIVAGIVAVSVAAIGLAGVIGRQINPAFVAFQDQITQEYGPIAGFFAPLLAGFVLLDQILGGTAVTWDDFVTDATTAFDNFVNHNIEEINSLINGFDTVSREISDLSHGLIQLGNISPLNLVKTPAEISQAASADKINSFLLSGKMSSASVAGVDPSVEKMVQEIQQNAEYARQQVTQSLNGNTSLQSLNTKHDLSNNTLNSVNSGVANLLSPLGDIKANGQALSQLAQQQLDAIQSQKDAQTAAIQILQDKIAELKQLPQTQPKYYTVTSTGSEWYGQTFQNGTEATQAAKDLADAQAALDRLKSQEVGTPQLLAGYLGGAGLSSTSGIGSIVTGALGLGDTAGWTAADVQKFIQTHDYGVFTAAANRDNAPHTVTQQEQIQALLNAWAKDGLKGYTAADAAKALGYGGGVTKGSQNIGSGPFGGLPGQYGQPTIIANVTVQGSVLSNQTLKDVIHTTVKDALQLGGW